MSTEIIKALEAMPKATRCAPPWGEYYQTEADTSLEMNKAESEIWNRAREWVLKTIKEGKES